MNNIYTITGHRPTKLQRSWSEYESSTLPKLTRFFKEQFTYIKPDKVIIGMALGVDTAAGLAAIALNIPLIGCVPHDDFGSNWVSRASLETLAYLIHKSEYVHYMYVPYSPKAMQDRNIWMVDKGDKVLALWDGSKSGTKNCIDYATRVEKPVKNLWDDWKLAS
jgi:uncharacterized phage-like protein YoqJ